MATTSGGVNIETLRHIKTGLIVFCLGTVWAATTLAYEVDTTKVRVPRRPPRSTAEKVLAVPEQVVLLPFTITKIFSRLIVSDIVLSQPVRRFAASLSRADRDWGMYPALGYSSTQGYRGGLVFTSRKIFTKGERFKAKATFSTNDYQQHYIRYTAPNKLGRIKDLTLILEYGFRPRERYYGQGADSRVSDEVAFTVEESRYSIHSLYRLGSTIDAGFGVDYRTINTFDGRDPDLEGDLATIKETFALEKNELRPVRLWSGQISLKHDGRNHPGQPTRGGWEYLHLGYHRSGGSIEFLSGRLDVRRYLNLFKKRTLAVRVLVEMIEPLGSKVVIPLYLRNHLGGGERLRGYTSHRFSDLDLALASMEYRWPVMEHLDAFVFIEEGRVFGSVVDDFAWTGWRYSAGAGLHLFGSRGAVLDLVFAFSDEDRPIYLLLSENL